MDSVKNAMGMGGGENKQQEGQATQEESSGGGFMDKINSMAGGGKESEKKEDYLDKGQSPPAPCQQQSLINARHRHVPREGARPRSSGQRVRYRTSQGRANV